MEDKGPVQRDAPVHRVEVVNAVLTKSQQKDKNLIQDINEPITGEQVVPSMGLNEPISVLGRIPILRPQQTEELNLIPRTNWPGPSNPRPVTGFVSSMRLDSVAQPNEVSITEASVPLQVVLISTQF
uniref:Predicted protein n=1 Tax=Physcomitrium patens TaxID=3218 RepID=A9TME9_PHYPA